VIAQSQAFAVQANRALKAIPSKPSAGQTFYDTFEDAEGATLQLVSRDDTFKDSFGNLGLMKYSMNAGTPKAWEIEYRRADNKWSMPFISANHFMDMMFDGATSNTSAPTHTLYASMAMTPTQTLDMSSGKMLHLTMEVDAHQSGRRWLAMDLAPASDPLNGFHPLSEGINNSDRGVFLEFKDGICTLDFFTGPTSPTNPIPTGTAGGSVHGARLWGGSGSFDGGPISCVDETFMPRNFSKNGSNLDDKLRFDFFITQNHAALFEDGQLIVQSDIPAGSFPWATVPLKAYYTHYVYHTDNDLADLLTFQNNGQTLCYPMNSFWFNNPLTGTAASQNVCGATFPSGYGFPYSDERHWDNMGFEVLPASDVPSGSFATLAPLVQPPPIQPVQSGRAPAVPTNLRLVR
jgi:hypothetical protein